MASQFTHSSKWTIRPPVWLRRKPRVLLFPFFSHPLCQTVLQALPWEQIQNLTISCTAKSPSPSSPTWYQGDLPRWPRCPIVPSLQLENNTSRVKPPYQSTLSHTKNTQEPHLTQARINCTLSLQRPDILSSPLCVLHPGLSLAGSP